MTIIGNIMKQILNKFGYLCWKAHIPKICPSLNAKILMIIGIDVYHAKLRFIEKMDVYHQRRSVGAFVAIFINCHNAQYLTSNEVIEVTAKRELICRAESDSDTSSVKSDSTASAAEKLFDGPEITKENQLFNFVQRAMKEHSLTPDHIIVYRDGIGESMIEAVKKTEVKQVQTACKSANLLFTVAQKNIHTRFFVEAPGNKFGNPMPGTVFSEPTSTGPEEFYLIPTKCSLSTVRPVRFIILHNDNAIPMDEFHAFTYAMCHVYPNWSYSITLPFPTQLAHKLAFQLGECVSSTTVHNDLKKNFFYL